MNPDHIGKITGLCTTGSVISDFSLQTNNEKLSFIKSKLSFLGSESGILEACETYVQKEFPSLFMKEDIDNFKIAFVIWVIGRFLAPSTDHPDGNINFWGALGDPDAIQSFNWSSYVYFNLREAARMVDWVIPYKKPLTFEYPYCRVYCYILSNLLA